MRSARGQRVVYTTPLKALSNQKYGDLQRQFGASRVGLLTGDTCINREGSILVMTTEVYRNMLLRREPEPLSASDDAADAATVDAAASAAVEAATDAGATGALAGAAAASGVAAPGGAAEEEEEDPLDGVGYVVLDEFHCTRIGSSALDQQSALACARLTCARRAVDRYE